MGLKVQSLGMYFRVKGVGFRGLGFGLRSVIARITDAESKMISLCHLVQKLTVRGFTPGYYPPVMENQMEKNMENEMETGII